MPLNHNLSRAVRPLVSTRALTTSSTIKPRHFLSLKDLTPTELATLVDNATAHKNVLQSASRSSWPLASSLRGSVISLLFSKRSTRTRISTEGAVVALGGHPMFLGKDDIQLGVNESLHDTSVVVSSMTAGIVARVGPHKDIADIAKDSSVPVINGLCDTFHPLQIIADFACLSQTLQPTLLVSKASRLHGLAMQTTLYDMCIGTRKLGIDMAVATPKGYEIPDRIKNIINGSGEGNLLHTNEPEEALKGANVIVTDTWISMGQEDEKQKRLEAFAGYQITEDMARRGGAATTGSSCTVCLDTRKKLAMKSSMAQDL